MSDVDADRDSESNPSPNESSPANRTVGGHTVRLKRDYEQIRQYAEEFLLKWMAVAIEGAKGKIVAEALEQAVDITNANEVDEAIMNVVSHWDFTAPPEQGSKCE